MAKREQQAESIYNLSNYLGADNVAPIYFFFGEDSFTISQAVKRVSEIAGKLIASEFDKQIIDVTKDMSIAQIVDEASAFPFGGAKKLVIVKNFENIGERKSLADYVKNPADFTILVISQSGKKLDLTKEPYASLHKNQFIFHAKELKGAELTSWVVREAKSLRMQISQDNAMALVDMIGENKALLEMNLLKFTNYIGKGDEITPEAIQKLSSATKEYTAFDLQDAIGAGYKSKALNIAYNILSHGKDPIYIVTMLSKYINTVARSMELSAQKVPEFQASKMADVSYYYYKNCAKARYLKSHSRLVKAADALLWADSTIKSSNLDAKSLTTILISRMMG